MNDDFSPQYDPKQVEDRWIEYWQKNRTFRPRSEEGGANSAKPYSIVIPPPNVTGSLHMGHALNSTLQDILARYHRMKGDNVLWVVGTDHAGIATQNVVERQLAVAGKKRDDLGREKFIERVWEWKAESGGTIIGQLRRLGASCDFDNERFTLDEGLSRAVRKVFVDLHAQGLIYRGKRLINWCPRCHTALSDLEVEHESRKGHLWHIRYPLVADTSQYVVVATTRPETLFGDVAVAVHPEDERYQALAGKRVQLPLSGRDIPVIADVAVDRGFGTGAVKITPAHDFNDYATAQRHGLPLLNILDASARLIENVPENYRGLDRFKAREQAVAELEAAGLLEKTAAHALSIGQCYRCKTVVEPYLSDQWFVKVAPLAEKAMQAVRQGRTRFVPQHWEKTYFQWMENIQDWCISRQIWWGHQIPAWYCMKKDQAGQACPPVVAEVAPLKCPTCGGTQLTQDADVLDTWFSSALWPFSTLGWPDETARLKTFYPTSVLVTAFDIIFFWVARMMMMGCHFMPEVPFRDVYIHALVRDPLGQKMSKSKGNVVDPLSMMHKYGTDAFRFTLAAFAAQGRDIKLDEQRIEGYRAFCNKIWNAARFGKMMAESWRGSSGFVPGSVQHPFNRWMLTHLTRLAHDIPVHIETYEFNVAAQKIYTFFWNIFCDGYIELIKPLLREAPHEAVRQETADTFFFGLKQSLLLLHPFMPFITEEILALIRVGDDRETCATLSTYPVGNFAATEWQDDAAVDGMLEVISAIRSIRQDTGLKANQELTVHITGAAPGLQILAPLVSFIEKMARARILQSDARPAGSCATAKTSLAAIFIPTLENGIDVGAERQRLGKRREQAGKLAILIAAKLDHGEFIANAPTELIAEQRGLLVLQESIMAGIDAALRELG